MELEFGQKLYQGKRLDEVINEVWTFNPAQVYEFGEFLMKITYDCGFNEDDTPEAWNELQKRHEYHDRLKEEATEAELKRVGGIWVREDNNRTPFVPDVPTLEAIKQVFGDLVTQAYLAYNPDKEVDSLALYETKDNIQVSCDAQTVILQFVDGRLVEFSNSEWAAISLIKQTKQ